MSKKLILSAIVALHMVILPVKSAKAQFSVSAMVGVFDIASFFIGLVPLPEMAKAGIFVLDLSTIPFRDSNKKIENGTPNVVEIGDLFNSRSESLLHPDSDADEYKAFQSYVKKLSHGQFGFGFIDYVYRNRTVLGTGGLAENSLIGEKYYDSEAIEGYLDFKPASTASIYFGLRNKAFGHSMGINPADVYNFRRPTNYSQPFDRKHRENPGLYTLGVDYYPSFGNLTFMASKGDSDSLINSHDSIYMSYGTLLGSEPVDLRLFALHDGEQTAGVSVNAPAPQGFTLYADLAAKQGVGIQRVLKESDDSLFALDTDEDTKFITNLTIGVNYALNRNMLINAEYSHLSNGYDEDEWTNYYSALEDNDSGGAKLGDGVFRQLIDNYESSYLRKDYGYLRFYNQDTFGTEIGTELATMVGLNDFSGRVDLNLSRNITDKYGVEAYAGYNFGQSDGEFALAQESLFAGAAIVAKY